VLQAAAATRSLLLLRLLLARLRLLLLLREPLRGRCCPRCRCCSPFLGLLVAGLAELLPDAHALRKPAGLQGITREQIRNQSG
jgi:hypothetical protein